MFRILVAVVLLGQSFAAFITHPVEAAAQPTALISCVKYVQWNATGANNGSSWNDAYTTLSSAIDAAVSGCEIWVAAGTYKPTSGTDRSISFTLKDGVSIYGGFARTESERSQRNPATNVTTLSGDIGVIGNASDNSYHVVMSFNLGSAVLDGFTVSGGNADDGSGPDGNGISNPNFHQYGGGLLSSSSTLILTNVIFSHNQAYSSGGAIFAFGGDRLERSHLTLTHAVLSDNYAGMGGGGIYNYASQMNLTNVIFSGNMAGNPVSAGGGLLIQNVNPNGPSTLTNVIFSGNSATYGGGGMEADYNDSILNNVTFVGNSGGYFGGGMYISGLDIVINPTLINVTFSRNMADQGGAIYNSWNVYPVIRNSILWGDVSPNGTEIDNNSASPSVSYSIVQGMTNDETKHIYGDRDPLFVNAASGDLHLKPSSPAIDVGNNGYVSATTDLDGQPRIFNGVVDLGAYEYIFLTFLPLTARK